MPPSRILGSITVTALTDGEGPFFQPRAEAFPDAGLERWRAADRRDPGTVTADGRWWLPFRSFAIRAGDGPVTLVDAVQLVDPELAYAHEEDAAAARASRVTLLRDLAARGPAVPSWCRRRPHQRDPHASKGDLCLCSNRPTTSL
ncbi:hypothetical protein [Micromonospora sp. NPDC023633]|uniref:hypothetical protein n=1 Tax=Micromonospora sp. NPDC023633 TaxID=3154320 RepID=UPI0033DCADBE